MTGPETIKIFAPTPRINPSLLLSMAGENDPAIDLAIICAILSSNMDIAIDRSVCLAGEVGLTGEIRPVNRVEQRILEAEKLGFKRIIIPDFKNLQIKPNIEIVRAKKVEDAFRLLFG